jgi:hypothetical protein
MDENEKTTPQKPASDKKLRLDLSEAMNQSFDDDDDIIELKDEVTLPPKAEKAKIERDVRVIEDITGDESAADTISRINARGKEPDAAENGDHLVDDLVFEEQDENRENADHPAEDLTFEEEDEDQPQILPLVDDEEPLETDATDEVEEVTEFDDILSEDSSEMLTLSDVAEESETEDEFLELIDVEEDSLTPKETAGEMTDEPLREEIEDDIIQFEGPGADVEDTELEDFINDSLGEEIRIDDGFEDDLTNALGVETESDINLSAPSSNTEEFDFEMDSSEISKKIDQLENIFFEDSEIEDELDEAAEPETETTGSLVSESGDGIDETSEKFDGLEDIFFDDSELEDEFDEDAVSEIETTEAAVTDAEDQADEISQKIDRLENTFFDDSELEDEFDEDAASEIETAGTAVLDAENQTNEISQKIDRLETTFFDESEAEAKLDEDEDDESEAEIGEAVVSETGVGTDESNIEIPDAEPTEPAADNALTALAGASQEQIEKSVERIIQQNLSDKIESMVRQTIEKAVSKEIERLKNVLLEDDTDEDF